MSELDIRPDVTDEKSPRPRRRRVTSAAVRRVALLLIPVVGLGAGATALAAGRSSSRDTLDLPAGCLKGVRVLVKFDAPRGESLNVHVRAAGREVVHLTGVTGNASVTVRLPRSGGRVQVTGNSSDGDEISEGRNYARCSSLPRPRPQPEPPAVSGGGEG